MNVLPYLLTGRRPERPDLQRPWRVWDLDSELRYMPVVRALPQSTLPICEVGSGPQGLAIWTPRQIIGVDPGDDDRHGGVDGRPLANFERVRGDGAHIPLADGSVAAAVAVDTMEHIPNEHRQAVLEEMQRVTAPGGRVIIMGPTGPAAAEGDALLLERYRQAGWDEGPIVWLGEHLEYGLPTVEELVTGLAIGRASRITARGVYNLKLWTTMHRALLGEFPMPRGHHLVHHLVWAPFGALARRLRRGPFYRYLVVADLR